MNLKDIYQNMGPITQGYKNLKTKDKQVQWMSEKRLRHCMTCTIYDSVNKICSSKKTGLHVRTGEIAKGCGCFMPSKTTLKKAVCPFGKW